MATLFNLTAETKSLQDKLIESIDENGEVDSLIVENLAVKEEEFDEKAINVASVYRSFLYESEKYEKEIARLKAIKDKIDGVADKLKANLEKSCQLVGREEIKGLQAQISFRKSTETEVFDLDKLPEEYKKAKVTITADKTKIKQAIQQGVEVDGARLVEKNNIQIK